MASFYYANSFCLHCEDATGSESAKSVAGNVTNKSSSQQLGFQ